LRRSAMHQTPRSPRDLPSVDRLLQDPLLQALPRELARQAARDTLEEARRALRNGGAERSQEDAAAENGGWAHSVADLPRLVAERVDRVTRPRLRPVINATGVIVHTNLGRAPLSQAALDAAQAAGAGYTNLEYELQEGARGSRHGLVTDLLRRLTGAED